MSYWDVPDWGAIAEQPVDWADTLIKLAIVEYGSEFDGAYFGNYVRDVDTPTWCNCGCGWDREDTPCWNCN